MTNERIATDSPLDPTQRGIFDILLGMIVPASADGSKPSAADVDVLGYIVEREADSLPTLREELDALAARAKAQTGRAFLDLTPAEQQRVVAEARAAAPDFLRGLALHTVTSYYQDDRVLEALGMEARPPFPQGYEVREGDLSLLDPVRQRAPFYRDAPDATPT